MSTRTLTTAQAAQQSNRTADGKYTNKTTSEADVDLVGISQAWDDLNDRSGTEIYDLIHSRASSAMSRANHKDQMHTAEDLAQDALVDLVAQLHKDGGESIEQPQQWASRVVTNKLQRMTQGKYYWPDTVALRLYHEQLHAREQSEGPMSESQKDRMAAGIRTNWATLNDQTARMDANRDRPTKDFHRMTQRNAPIYLDGIGSDGDDETGAETATQAFLANNASSLTKDPMLTDAEQVRASFVEAVYAKPQGKAEHARASQLIWSGLTDEDAPAPVPASLTGRDASRTATALGVKVSARGKVNTTAAQVSTAIQDWESGEDDTEATEALFAPFGGSESLSMVEQQKIVNSLRAHGRDNHHVSRMWATAFSAAQAS